MLSRRAVLAGTTALAAGCNSLGSSFSVPSQAGTIDLIWASESFAGFRDWGLGPNDQEETLKQVVAALAEDTENPHSPAKGRYTLTPRFMRMQDADPPPDDMDELLAWFGGLEVDLLSVPPFLAQLLGERGILLPLDQLISADVSGLTQDTYPYLLDHFRSEGGLFALPVDASPTMIHYSPRDFSSQSVPIPDESWDWDDLVESAAKLVQRNENGEVLRWGLITQHRGYWWALWQNEADVADPATMQCRLLDPAATEALQFCHDLIHTHGVSPPATSADAHEFFKPHPWPAMFFSSTQGNWSSENKWAALPRGKQRSIPVIGNMGIAITDRTENTEVAFTALKGLVGVMQRFVEVPAQKEAVARLSDFRKTLLPAEIAAIQQSMEFGRAVPLNAPMWRAMSALEEGIARGDDVVTVVNDACSVVEA